MIESIVLLMRKLIGIGVVGAVGFTGLGAAGDAFDTVKDYLLIAATNVEIEGAHKVLFGVYVRDNRYPPEEAIWSCFEENYSADDLDQLKTDGWFTPYAWLEPDYEIRSAGPDKIHETRDDFGQRYPSLVKR